MYSGSDSISNDIADRYSITRVLYEWLHKRRLISVVAQEMGMKDATLSAELRPTNPQAKLGADELVPLFEAIRRAGGGDAAKGILHRFISELKGEDLRNIPDRDLVSHMLELHRSLGILSGCAARVPDIVDTSELMKLKLILRTEVLPLVLRMEAVIDARITSLNERSRNETKGMAFRTAHPVTDY
jgi:hypothetical protein